MASKRRYESGESTREKLKRGDALASLEGGYVVIF